MAAETVAEEMSENVSEEEAETDREVGETMEVVKRIRGMGKLYWVLQKGGMKYSRSV